MSTTKKQFNLRLDDETRACVAALAQADGISATALITQLIKRAARRSKSGARLDE